MNFIPALSLTFRSSRRFELVATGEYAYAPKVIAIKNGGTDYYSFNRASLGVLGNLHFYAGRKHTFFIGGGLLYNTLTFTDPDKTEFVGSSIGTRLQAGFSFILGRANLQPILGVDFASANGTNSTYSFANVDLNYSGVTIGVQFNFIGARAKSTGNSGSE